MHPPRFPYPKEPSRGAEYRFFKACQEQLDDTWIVLYEQHWFGHRNGKQQSGEADFVMLHASEGIFVVEVKGGQVIGVDKGEWYTVPHGKSTRTRVKNPFTQAADSKFSLWAFIKENLPDVRLGGELGHMVVFPGHRQTGDISPQARRELICDREDLGRLPETMKRLSLAFPQRSTLTEKDLQLLVQRLMPSFRLLGEESVEFDEFFDQLNRLTDNQLLAFATLRQQRALNIHGGAGTGKTILAFHRAIELALEGKAVLYLCHSRPLAEYLRLEMKIRGHADLESLTIRGVDELAEQYYEELHEKLNESGPGPGFRGFFDCLDEYCLELAVSGDRLIDALIVDEAQSVDCRFVEALLVLLREGGNRYIFGDMNQCTIRRGEAPLGYSTDSELHETPPSFIDTRSSALLRFGMNAPIELNLNCRSSVEIAQFAHEIVQSRTQMFGSSFEEVKVVAQQHDGLGAAIALTIQEWTTRYGISATEIEILVPDFQWIRHSALFGEASFVNEQGLFVDDELVIDWIGNDGPSQYARHQDELSNIKQFLAEVGDAEGLYEERLAQYCAWWREKWDAVWEESVEDEKGADDDELQNEQRQFDSHTAEVFRMREEGIEALNCQVFRAKMYEEFIGLEAKAIIAVLPLVSKGRCLTSHHALFASVAYTMSTRARALLAVMGEPDAIELLGAMRKKLSLGF